jgi:lipopolysaccharide transport system ATP-binding protein
MSEIAIHVEGLSKLYRIGERQRYKALRDTLSNVLYAPFRAAASLRNGHNGHQSTASNRSSNNHFWALKDISFEIKKGEAFGIIGRNGAGKSTLLKILSRITKPTEGYIRMHGRVGSLLEVGTGFHPELTGRENTYLNGAIIGMRKKEIDRKFDEIVAFAEIEKFIDTPVKFYSSGMYVRLAFAVAAHLESEILIVDEVLAVGDAQFQKKCVGKMQDAAKNEGRTVLFVSHNMPTVEKLCTKVMLLDNGRVKCSGSPSEIVMQYLDGGGDAETHWVRTPPYPEYPHLRRVRLINGDGSECRAPTCAGLIGVQMEISLPRQVNSLCAAIGVYNDIGDPIFASGPHDANVGVPSAPGVYQTTVMFPKGIFLPRRYRVQVALYTPFETFENPMNILRFDVQDVASLANSGWGRRIGSVLVCCTWSPFEKLEH